MERNTIVTDDVDTITPLDVPGEGFGHDDDLSPVEVERDADDQAGDKQEPEAASASDEPVATSEEITVATPVGYVFASAETDAVVSADGLTVTREQGLALIAESDDLVFVVEKED